MGRSGRGGGMNDKFEGEGKKKEEKIGNEKVASIASGQKIRRNTK